MFLAGTSVSSAQTPFERIKENPCLAAGLYHSYDAPDVMADTPAPKGYKPVYISHYGRHGSRFHSDRQVLANIPYALMAAHSKGLLTDTGEALLSDLDKLVKANAGMAEELSLRGVHEHEDLARRMASRYSTVFRRDSIRCVSSNYSRCIMSMMSFTGALRAAYPYLKLKPNTGEKYFNLLSRELPDKAVVTGLSLKTGEKNRAARFNPDRFINTVFKEVPVNIDAFNVAQTAFIFGCVAECVQDNIGEYVNVFRYFTAEELYALWSFDCDRYIQTMCANDVYYDKITELSKPVLKDIVVKADNALRVESNIAADLRFGHDNGLTPLTFLIGIAGRDKALPYNGSYDSFPSFIENPMASNIQLIFYKAKGREDLVKVLYNEKETAVPALAPIAGPYYKWKDMREYLLSKCGNAASMDRLVPGPYEKINTYMSKKAALMVSALRGVREHLVLLLPAGYEISKVDRSCGGLVVNYGGKRWTLTVVCQGDLLNTGSDFSVKIDTPDFDPEEAATQFAELILHFGANQN